MIFGRRLSDTIFALFDEKLICVYVKMYMCIVLGGSFVCCIYSPIYYLYFYYRICVKRKKLFNCHSSFPSRRLFFDGQAKIIFEFLSNSYCKRV